MAIVVTEPNPLPDTQTEIPQALEIKVTPSETQDLLAVCVVGALRTFHLKHVRQSIVDNFVNALEPDPAKRRIFFHVSTEADFICDSNPVNTALGSHCRNLQDRVKANPSLLKSEQFAEDFEGASVVVEDFTCANENSCVSQHACCHPETAPPTSNSESWHTFYAYQRKLACLKQVKEYAQEHKVAFSNYAIVRPDLYFFEPIVPINSLSALNERVYMAAKEAGESPGDYIYIFPHALLEPFEKILDMVHTLSCNGKPDRPSLPWPAEYKLHALFDSFPAAVPNLPYQIFPFNFVIVRSDGSADCFRLTTEVYRHSKTMKSAEGNALTPAHFCTNLVNSGYFRTSPLL